MENITYQNLGVIDLKLENEKNTLTAVNSEVINSDFKNCNLSGMAIQCCNLSGMKMNDVNLTGLSISDANLSELKIDGAQWGGAFFRWIGYGNQNQPDVEHNKQPVQFSNCNLQQGSFTDCNLSNVRLENCDITGLVINGVDIELLLKQHASNEQK